MSGLRLLASAPTPALRAARFGGDDDLDEGGRAAALAVSGFGRDALWVCSPARAAVETAQALGRTPVPEKALADADFGTWSGRTLDEVAHADPRGLHRWLSDPSSAPHGGEALAAVRERAGTWIDAMSREAVVAVAHPIVVRAVLTHALQMPDERLWGLDVAPLSLTRLTWRSGRWNLHFPPAA